MAAGLARGAVSRLGPRPRRAWGGGAGLAGGAAEGGEQEAPYVGDLDLGVRDARVGDLVVVESH